MQTAEEIPDAVQNRNGTGAERGTVQGAASCETDVYWVFDYLM